MENNPSSKVKVVVRCRPLLPREKTSGKPSIQVSKDRKQVAMGDGKQYIFDNVYDENCPQEQIYNNCVKPLIESCLNGYNATVLACKINADILCIFLK